MESPTRLSQSRFFRFGRLSSSKASRKSSSGYSNHSFTAHPLETVDQNCPATESSYAGSEIIYQQLNHRSASMSTLPSSLPPGTYSGLPYGENFGMHQPRLSQLQTLEAKMASIAVSLSGGGRRSGTGTLPHHQPSLRSSPSIDTVRSVGKASSSSGGHPLGVHHHQQQQQQQQQRSTSGSSKQIRNEIELLRKIIQDKDTLIQSLQQQREQQGATMATVLQQQQQQTVTNGTNWATSNERQQIERRLALIHRDIELKRAAIKNLRLSLQQTNVSDNIDSHIKQAETEYQLEREETNMLNLQDEKRTLLLRFGGAIHQWGRNGVGGGGNGSNNLASNSLFRILHEHAPLVIIINKVEYDAQNPSLKLEYSNSCEERSGLLPLVDACTVQWARDDLNLKAGDKVLEINGQLIPGHEKMDLGKLLIHGQNEIVVARQSREESYLMQIQDLSSKLERVSQERDGLKGENLRLKHRISYLEEVRHDEELAEEEDSQPLIHKEKASHRGSSKSSSQLQQSQLQQHDSLSSGEGQSLYRSEVRVQAAPVRQKPPRTSKLKSNSNSAGRHPSVPDADYGDKRSSSSADGRRGGPPTTTTTESSGDFQNGGVGVEAGSMNRIKTSSIVDRHFGHVIRVTHHHHPHQQATPSTQTPSSSSSSHDYASRRQRVPADSISDLQSVASYDSFIDSHPTRHLHIGQSMETVSNVSLMTRPFNQRSPSSPTRSEVQSVASMDLERRRHGYISDEQTISSSMSSYGGLLTGGKKPKPVPPRKPSFLYLNRASSLQSVNGIVKTNSMDRSSNKIDPNGKHSEAESWNNNTAPKTSLRTALSGNLKWNILSSSRSKNGGSTREKEDRE
ncbi:uncharacterized protein LOC130685912 [Daphnia carinata]|uniref:uncharacterized protein LOC130685912 n=1 Tax=Daphnia carinata TaxID=120202 RepID=UPI002868BDD3|nr:uncharacterized protein LOC130685912 [Daphnia carinata]